MGFTHCFDEDKNRISFIADGEEGVESLIAAIESLMAEPEYVPGYDALVDLSQLIPAVSVDNLRLKKLAGFISSIEDRIGAVKWAFVAPGFIQKTFTNLIIHMVRADRIEMRIFPDGHSAREWLDAA